MRLPSRLLLALLGAGIFGCLPGEAATIAASGDASISHDEAAGTWMLSAGGTALTLGIDAGRDFSIISLTTPSGVPWIAGAEAPDTFVRIGSQTLPFGNRHAGFDFRDVTVTAAGDRLQLNATFDLPSARLRITRHYAIVSGSPAFETWTSYTPTGHAGDLSDLNGITLTIPAGTVRWLTGLQGDSADVFHDSAFTLQEKTLAPGDHFELGSTGRSSEDAVPWFAIDGARDEFFASLMWSGAWSLEIDRAGGNLVMTLGLAPMTTAPGEPIDGPRVVFGAVRGDLSRASAALNAYVLDGIRQGRPLAPLVMSNTWYSYWTRFDETTIRGEMAVAASLGVELFVVDAGWYAGAGEGGPFDFDSGLGLWTPDRARFPNGLPPLTEYAHSLGLKFGLWVEPERLNLSLVADRVADEHWLATHDGAYGSERTAQICLAGRAARTWILGRLTALLDEVQPDYLKWDNNFWINCDREGHGHGETDGNFAHVTALYDVLATLRARYPELLIENVSGGGKRLDLAMLRYTDVGWMDDRTAPSIQVRHNVEGLSAVFPPAYLLSFLTNHEREPIHASPDLSLQVRSRMAGAIGLSFRSGDLTEADVTGLTHEIDIYKATRAALSVAAASLLSRQATADGGPAWDVLQETAAGTWQVLLYAFQYDSCVRQINIKPTGLVPATSYRVQSVDTGVLGIASGADLMAHGIDVLQSPNTAAHILILTAQR